MNEKAKAKIGLVLGGGGPVGLAFHSGVLKAIYRSTGWDPRTADVIVGTSAGAQIAALLRAGMSAEDLSARITGEPMSPRGQEVARHYRRPSHKYSWRNFEKGKAYGTGGSFFSRFRNALKAKPRIAAALLLPDGRVSLEAMAEGFRDVFGKEWPLEKMWICSVGMNDGRRGVFGREGDAAVDVGTAVAASASLPALCKPVIIEGQGYLDGGLHSPTNLDVLAGRGLDLVIVISAMTCAPGPGPFNAAGPFLRHNKKNLLKEVRVVEDKGSPVFVIEPTAADASTWGFRFMDISLMPSVVVRGFETASKILAEHQPFSAS